jgi:hypothetical protein
MANPSTTPIYELTRAPLGGEATTVQWMEDGASQITDDISGLADGVYVYTLTAYGDLCGYSSSSAPYYIQLEDGELVSYPQEDVSNLSVQPTAGGKFLMFWQQTNSAIQDPTHFNIYYCVDPSADEWTLDGSQSLSLYKHHRYQYTTATAFAHGVEVMWKVLPAVSVGSNEYEKSSDTTVSAEAVATGPTITASAVSVS